MGIALAFVIVFSTFLLAFVNWPVVLECNSAKCAQDKVLKDTPFANVTNGDTYDMFVLSFTIVCCLFMLHNLFMCFYDIKEFYLIKRFVNDKLGVSEREMRTIQWTELVDKILELQEAGVLIVKHRLSPLDIANRIMRRDNYFMAMMNKDVLNLALTVPFLRTTPPLTKTMEWNLNYC